MIVALLRIWFAAFLAAKIDQSVGWSWGLVFLPVWLYLFMQYAFAVYYHYWCVRRLHNVSHRQSLTLCFSVFCFCFCFLYINNLEGANLCLWELTRRRSRTAPREIPFGSPSISRLTTCFKDAFVKTNVTCPFMPSICICKLNLVFIICHAHFPGLIYC